MTSSASHPNPDKVSAGPSSGPAAPPAKGMAGAVQRSLPPGTQASQVSTVVSSRHRQPSALRKWGLRLAAPVVLAGATIYAVNQYMNTRQSTSPGTEGPTLVERIVAAENLQSGIEIDIHNLALREVPHSWAGPDSVAPDEIESLLGMRLTQDLAAGTPLTFSMIRRAQPNEFLDLLEPGRRAVTLPVGRITASAGLLQPGEYIDLFVTFEHRGRRITSLLMSQIRVLHVSRSDGEGYQNEQELLTLDVTTEQAAKLIAAQQGGVLTAVQMPAPALTDQGSAHSQTRTSRSRSGQTLHTRPAANHLAGFAGVEASFEQLEVPDILYGDQESASAQDHS
ncbi:Flp pilus assembly protein CpaB [Orrella marina]|uniref:Flp pilus assembly protein CpaB n=1 Tax=Orrella marina TaxID=2163011 RepID=A0A2R4XI46_9BURK|nr:Flp pilus assembly protein CpaB [Orrella marina]AWB33470.1 Flp pilus assembly protein CpaB [Orrella marina]